MFSLFLRTLVHDSLRAVLFLAHELILRPPAARRILNKSLQYPPAKEDAMPKVNLTEKFAKISEYWKPYIAAELNGQHIKLDKLKGEFVFHHHEHEDEMFLVVK